MMAVKKISNYSFNFNKYYYDILKVAEKDYKISINKEKYNLVRLDGASFSKQFKLLYEKFSQKIPYNPYLVFAMQATAVDTMKEFPFIMYGYSFSDEISFLIDNANIDFRKMDTLQKMISILSSFVSSAFNINLHKVTNLKIEDMLNEVGQIDANKYAVYEQFIKNSMYLINVALRNDIPLNQSSKQLYDKIEKLYTYTKYEINKKLKLDLIEEILNLIKQVMPFNEFSDHIFYFDARLISLDNCDKVYDYFKARQGFACYKFIEDLATSLTNKRLDCIASKNTNMYFDLMYKNGIPASVYNAFDNNLRLGTSFYKGGNGITRESAVELKKQNDKQLQAIIKKLQVVQG